jgi:Flp pilus assembly CpaE family ATPase
VTLRTGKLTREIEERKRVEKALQEAQKQLERRVENARQSYNMQMRSLREPPS